jgi:hypothetical protein
MSGADSKARQPADRVEKRHRISSQVYTNQRQRQFPQGNSTADKAPLGPSLLMFTKYTKNISVGFLRGWLYFHQ